MDLIFRDCDGIPGRIDVLRETFPGNVWHVTPHHLAKPRATRIEIPEAWLPWGADWQGVPRARREWFASDTLGLAAVDRFAINSDFVWFVESDIWAPPEVWASIFTATAHAQTDGIFAKLMPREHSFARMLDHWNLPTSAGATHAHLQTLYRLSRRAIQWATDSAAELSNVYAEVKTASQIVRHGGTVADLRTFVSYSAPRAFTGHPGSHRFAPGVMNHPVKINLGKNAPD